jgi:hypothetical protein
MRKLSGNTMVRFSDYVPPDKAAEIIGCTKGRVHQLRRAGDLKDVIPVGKNRFLFGRKECEKVGKTPAKTGRPRKALAC